MVENRKLQRRKRGFTLIEVMFGIALCGIAVAGLSSMIPLATKGQRASREYLQMADAAQAKLDRLKDLGYGRLNAEEITAASVGVSTGTNDEYQFSLRRGVDSVTDATGTITVSDFNADIKKVVVNINWTSGGQQATQSNYELQGLVARE